MRNWYSREYLGKQFDKFLNSDMNSTDILHLQEELRLVSEQLQLSNSFIENGFQNKTGRIHIRQSEAKGS